MSASAYSRTVSLLLAPSVDNNLTRAGLTTIFLASLPAPKKRFTLFGPQHVMSGPRLCADSVSLTFRVRQAWVMSLQMQQANCAYIQVTPSPFVATLSHTPRSGVKSPFSISDVMLTRSHPLLNRACVMSLHVRQADSDTG